MSLDNVSIFCYKNTYQYILKVYTYIKMNNGTIVYKIVNHEINVAAIWWELFKSNPIHSNQLFCLL